MRRLDSDSHEQAYLRQCFHSEMMYCWNHGLYDMERSSVSCILSHNFQDLYGVSNSTLQAQFSKNNWICGARDFNTLWDGLRRLMIILYQRERSNALLMTLSSFLLLLLPFIQLPFLLFSTHITLFFIHGYYSVNAFLLLIDIAIIAILFSTSVIQSKYTVFRNLLYILGSPLAGVIIFLHISSILDAAKKNAINWKGRQYTIKQNH
jgi:hypothetical protein